jgi:hypothetical protein
VDVELSFDRPVRQSPAGLAWTVVAIASAFFAVLLLCSSLIGRSSDAVPDGITQLRGTLIESSPSLDHSCTPEAGFVIAGTSYIARGAQESAPCTLRYGDKVLIRFSTADGPTASSIYQPSASPPLGALEGISGGVFLVFTAVSLMQRRRRQVPLQLGAQR